MLSARLEVRDASRPCVSDPFIIWTMRRTGGTSFGSLLTTLSEHPAIEHEPLNTGRVLGWITEHWEAHQDPTHLNNALGHVLDQKPLIKHCYELAPDAINRALIAAATARGYRHIVLDRRAEVDRILSLELAKETGAWGPEEAREIYAEIEAGQRQLSPIDIHKGVAHIRFCAKQRRWLATELDQARTEPVLIYFEELYDDFDAGRAAVENLLRILGINAAGHADFEGLLSRALTQSSQKSRSIAQAVPNIDAARAALAEAHGRMTYRFDAAVRSTPLGAAVTPGSARRTIIDVQADPGDDVAYFLAKGFDVIALEEDPATMQALDTRFRAEVASGRARIVSADLSAGDGNNATVAEAIASFGAPYYVKIESLTGAEHSLLTGMTSVPRPDLPPFLSVQVNEDWSANLDLLVGFGYGAFQLIRQGPKYLPPQPNPAREGTFAAMEFTATMSGPFGRDLPDTDWADADRIRVTLRAVQAEKKTLRAAGQNPGWHDLHAQMTLV